MMINKIEELLQKQNVSIDDVMFVITNETQAEGTPENIKMFNSWRQNLLSVKRHEKHVLTFEDIEIRSINLQTIDLRYCKFINCSFYTCNFDGASFSDSKFINCHFCACHFGACDFHGADIDGCKFEFIKADSELYFLETRIKDSIFSFEDVSRIDFKYSSFDSVLLSTPSKRHDHGVTFINPYGFSENEDRSSPALIHSIDLTGCAIRNSTMVNIMFNRFFCDNASIYNTDIVNCYVQKTICLKNTTISNVRVSSSFFEILNQHVLFITKYIDKRGEITKDLLVTLRTLCDNFGFIGNSSDSSKYYLLYKNADQAYYFHQVFSLDIKSTDRLNNLKPYISRTFAKYLFNYGESPLVVSVWILFVILMTGTWSYFIKLSDAEHWIDNIYLSAITFATVGYGDIKPCGSWGRILFGAEGLVGVFLMSIFVVVLTRKLIK